MPSILPPMCLQPLRRAGGSLAALVEGYLLSVLASTLQILVCLYVIPAVRFFLRPSAALVLAAALGCAQAAAAPPLEPVGSLELCAVLFGRGVSGLLLGAPLAFALEALAACGRLLDLARGESIGGQINPALSSHTSPLELALRLFGLCLFFSLGGCRALLSAAAAAGDLQFAGAKLLSLAAAVHAASLFCRALLIGAALAAPVLISALVFDICAGFAGRALGRVNTSFEFLPLKLFLGLLGALLVTQLLPAEVSLELANPLVLFSSAAEGGPDGSP